MSMQALVRWKQISHHSITLDFPPLNSPIPNLLKLSIYISVMANFSSFKKAGEETSMGLEQGRGKIHLTADLENTWLSVQLLKARKLLLKHKNQEQSLGKATLSPEPGHDPSVSTRRSPGQRWETCFPCGGVGGPGGLEKSCQQYSLLVSLLNSC